MDGDHMGTAPFREFCLLVPAVDDKNPGPMGSAKELQELSTKVVGMGHPAVFLLFPNNKPADAPQLEAKEGMNWVLNWKGTAVAGKEKAPLGFGLTLIGHTTAE
jgi:hypothetical protein